MKHYWIKYSYVAYSGKNQFGNYYSTNSTLDEFVEFANVEEFKSYCAELQSELDGFKIESIVKL